MAETYLATSALSFSLSTLNDALAVSMTIKGLMSTITPSKSVIGMVCFSPKMLNLAMSDALERFVTMTLNQSDISSRLMSESFWLRFNRLCKAY